MCVCIGVTFDLHDLRQNENRLLSSKSSEILFTHTRARAFDLRSALADVTLQKEAWF